MHFKQHLLKKRTLTVLVIFILVVVIYIYNTNSIVYFLVKTTQNFVSVELSKGDSRIFDARKEFEDQWCRMLNARTDWESIIRSCDGRTSWKNTNTDQMKLLQTDARSSYIYSFDIRPAGEFSRIFIKTLTKDGALKTIGGDSWRVKINGTASVCSKVFDNDNGTYEVLFLCEDEGYYNIFIYLDYSLCNGLMDPPDNWFIKGNAQGKNQGIDVIGTPSDFLMKPLRNTPFLINVKNKRMKKSEEAPTCKDSCSFLWDGQGRWKDMKWKPYFKEKTKLHSKKRSVKNKPGNLLIYGDSVNVFFAQSLQQRPRLCQQNFKTCKSNYNWIYHIKNAATAKKQRDNLDFNVTRVISEFKNIVYSDDYNNENNTVIFNFGLHFVESTNFSSYQTLIKSIAEIFSPYKIEENGGKRYLGNIIWKSSTAIQKERADLPQLHWRRFFTNYRIQLYNAYAADVMCKNGIPVIDDYPISESYPLGTGTHSGKSIARNDIVHYNNEAFYPLEEYLETEFSI